MNELMNDYKKLICKLRFYAQTAGDRIRDICADSPNAMFQAADVIEQLVKERDGWMEYAKQERKRSIERFHELAVELDRVKKERDAAVNDVPHICQTCYGNNMKADCIDNPCWNCKGQNNPEWGWRGVKEDNDEID